ncbi:MAG: GNAT family N-acetyltransferase [Candidatus Amulumruptor caecigallinarius]|nr:GNAT family N-acetyltransferase [Candidatus Amulumruptor caecigallinarius]MCM1396663.1 GNAT family N-acetyltransferase [Candidatus Amulumruptor caecigallinarius]MCM1453279.1 GNAT family N-acetyltransferase [bacterium]
MSTKDNIRKLWSDTFGDTPEYLDMYFSDVYREEDAMTATSDDGKLLSSLLLQRYPFLYQGQETTMGYIAGVMTRRNVRGRGLMSGLLCRALERSRERGDIVASLIPLHDWLYFYYDRFGFATVLYVDPQRFTALHTFTPEETYLPEEDMRTEEAYRSFSAFERARGCGVLHTERDYLNILADNALDGGRAVAVRDSSGGIAAMAFAVVDKAGVTVTELMGISHDAREGALAELRRQLSGLPFKVLAPPLAEHRRLYDRGMARIINAGETLRLCAAANPQWQSLIRVYDPILADNTAVYAVADGDVLVMPYDAALQAPLDFDVNITVLTEIAFSAPRTGDILRFPSERPVISLMLE